MLIDTHIHLDAAEFDGDRDAVISAARLAGVCGFVIPAVCAANFQTVRELAQRLAGAAFSLGIHPLFTAQAADEDLSSLRLALRQGGACAVGEIGLDAYSGHPDLGRQEWFFVEQLKLACEFDLPVILHIRRAQDRVLKYLRRYRPRGGIAHAFNGSQQQADAFIDLGFKLGFGGAMSYAGSSRIRALAASLPLECLVLESDAPDMAPAWAAGQRNAPLHVARYAQLLADLRGISLAAIEAATRANADMVLPLAANLWPRDQS